MRVPEGFILKQEAASICGCTKRTVDNMMRQRLIPFYKFGQRVLFKRDEVLTAINQSKVPSRSSMAEPSLYKGQVVGSIPAATTIEQQGPITKVFRNECWDNVCTWLQICAKSPDRKQRNLATETLRFITKFDL